MRVTVYHAPGSPKQSHALLSRAAERWCAENGRMPPGEAVRPAGGKPYFPVGPHFSVSHSGGHWLCAFADAPVGLDVQETRTVDVQRLARRFFHPLEAAYLAEHPEDFFRVWCAKESYVKYTGSGIAKQFAAFSVVENGKISGSVNGAFLKELSFSDGFTLYLCSGESAEVEFCELS